METIFQVSKECVTVRSTGSGRAIVYLHVYTGDGGSVWEKCLELGCRDFTLVSIGNLDWSDDMSPWECPPTFKGDDACAGHADRQLELLIKRVMPRIEARLSAPPAYSAIAGYSLAGLFATWSVLNTNVFSRMASVSGSLWFPGFSHHVAQHEPAKELERAYFSLGSTEARTRNNFVRSVEKDTRSIVESFSSRDVTVTFEENPGNHFKEPALRTAKGIRWILDA